MASRSPAVRRERRSLARPSFCIHSAAHDFFFWGGVDYFCRVSRNAPTWHYLSESISVESARGERMHRCLALGLKQKDIYSPGLHAGKSLHNGI